MVKLDRKFHGVVVKNKNGAIVPPDQWVVFLAKDDAVPSTFAFYEQECVWLGAGKEQVEAVRAIRERIEAWRAANPGLCKTPDVQAGELLE